MNKSKLSSRIAADASLSKAGAGQCHRYRVVDHHRRGTGSRTGSNVKIEFTQGVQMSMQTANAAGSGNFIVQIAGDGNHVAPELPHLTLTRHYGLARLHPKRPRHRKAARD